MLRLVRQIQADFKLSAEDFPVRLPGALIGDDLIGDLLPFIQAAQTGPFDRADMNEHIGAAGVGLNEPEAFRRIEPFHCFHEQT